jgi:hypothetical protein
MNLETRVKRLESKLPEWMTKNADVFQMSNAELEAAIAQSPFDLTLLTDAELMSVDAWLSKVDAPLTPELEAMFERIKR